MVLIVAASLAFGVGGLCMKASEGFSRPLPGVGVIVLFVLGAVLLTRAVQRQGLSNAYIVGLGVEAVVSMAIGRYAYGEHLTRLQAAGAVLILAGVASMRYG